MSKAEYRRVWSPKFMGASGLIVRGSLSLLLTRHLTALNLSETINEIKIFIWQRDCEDFIK